MAIDLPPPPEHPGYPPPVFLPDETAITIATEDGVELSALARRPPAPVRSVVLCHPHPLYGGTMHNAVIVAILKELAQIPALATLRFNFRGADGSTGTHGHGRIESRDVAAAVGRARADGGAPVALVGYSFGAAMALSAAFAGCEIDRLTLVAPPIRLLKSVEVAPASFPPTQIIAAGRDEYSDLADTERLARSLGAMLVVLDQATHFFVKYRREVAVQVALFAAPEALG